SDVCSSDLEGRAISSEPLTQLQAAIRFNHQAHQEHQGGATFASDRAPYAARFASLVLLVCLVVEFLSESAGRLAQAEPSPRPSDQVRGRMGIGVQPPCSRSRCMRMCAAWA